MYDTSPDPLGSGGLADGVRAPAGHLALLVEDPDLLVSIPLSERQRAERALVIPLVAANRGPIDFGHLVGPNLGVLVLDGFVQTSTSIGERAACHVSGPGDVLHPGDVDPGILPVTCSYDAMTSARCGVMDHRFIAAVRRWPGLLIALHERLRVQEHRMAVHAAASKLRRVEDRVLSMLWQLGEQWGTVTAAGIVVPLSLTHAEIGRVTGAQRPTITSALASLTHDGLISRQLDGAYLLAPESWRELASAPLTTSHADAATAPAGSVH